MENGKKKDALTDLVDVAVSVGDTPLDRPLKDGEAVTPSGEVVTMGIDDGELTRIARNLLKWVRTKKEVEKQIMLNKAEKYPKQPPRKGE